MKVFMKGLLVLFLVFFAVSTSNSAGFLETNKKVPKKNGLENGVVLNVAGDSAYYLHINGYAAHIPSPAVYKCMELENSRIVKISRKQLDNMPKTAFLIRGSSNRVYRVTGDTKRHVPNQDVFKRLGFNELEIISVTDQALECIKLGPPLQ